MPSGELKSPHQIVPASSHALTVRSAALVARGLRDLTRDSNWLVKKLAIRLGSPAAAHNASEGSLEHVDSAKDAPRLAISPTGQLCASSPLVRAGAERIVVYDIELGTANIALSVPGEPPSSAIGLPAAFAWSSTGRRLVAAWGGWGNRLHAFDLHAKRSVGAFGEFSEFPRGLAWSESGRYFACASGRGSEARVRLWEKSHDSESGTAFADPPLTEAGGARSFEDWFAGDSSETEPDEDAICAGFGRLAFSPDESTLAVVVEMEGEWADDSIVILDVPTLRCLRVFAAQGHVTGMAWTFDSRNLVYCSGGQAYRLSSESPMCELLPFGAELVVCHPHLPVCLCFSSWLKNSAKGRLFIANLANLSTQDEYAAEGVLDLRWSADGAKAYAITADGLAYIHEPPLL